MSRTLMAAAAAVIVAALGGCETMNNLLDDKPAGVTESTQTAAAPAAAQEQDVTFVQTAAAAGSKEVALAELAMDRSGNAAVDGLAQQMVTDHGAANTELMALADARDIEVSPAPSEEEAASEVGLSTLEGAAFDAAYVDQMVKNHEKSIALFETQAAQGTDPALVEFAEEKLPTIRMHLEHARTLQAGM